MVKEGIALGHKISGQGIQGDQAKVEVISKLPSPIYIKGVRIFLRHVSFLIRGSSKTSPRSIILCVLKKEVKFRSNRKYVRTFNCLKKKLVSTTANMAPNWL